MNNRFFGILCAICGALAVTVMAQRSEIVSLKLVLWQIASEGGDAEALEEMF